MFVVFFTIVYFCTGSPLVPKYTHDININTCSSLISDDNCNYYDCIEKHQPCGNKGY
eukprot:Pgem_evm1s1505